MSTSVSFLTHNNAGQLKVILSSLSPFPYYSYDPDTPVVIQSTFKPNTLIPVTTNAPTEKSKSNVLTAISDSLIQTCLLSSEEYTKMGYLNDVAAGSILSWKQSHTQTLHILAIAVLKAYRHYGLATNLLKTVLENASRDPKLKTILAYVPVTTTSKEDPKPVLFDPYASNLLTKAGFSPQKLDDDRIQIVSCLPQPVSDSSSPINGNVKDAKEAPTLLRLLPNPTESDVAKSVIIQFQVWEKKL